MDHQRNLCGTPGVAHPSGNAPQDRLADSTGLTRHGPGLLSGRISYSER